LLPEDDYALAEKRRAALKRPAAFKGSL